MPPDKKLALLAIMRKKKLMPLIKTCATSNNEEKTANDATFRSANYIEQVYLVLAIGQFAIKSHSQNYLLLGGKEMPCDLDT